MTTSVFDSFRAFCARESLPPEAVAERFRDDPASRKLLVGLETGALPEIEFEVRLGEVLGVASAGLIERMFADGVPDAPMQTAVRRARHAGIRTGLISNSWGTGRYDRALLAELFDGVVISGEVGIRKPHRDIYVLGAQAVGLRPADCVYVDDLGFNLAPAAELGMATVRHRAAADTIAELERLLNVNLR